MRPFVSFLVLVVATAAVAKEWPNKVPSAVERGRELYERHCLACHGDRAAGDGPAAAALVAKIPDLSQGLPAGVDREELVRIVMRGKGAMPGFDESFHDLKPWETDYRSYARNVLDYMDGVGRAPARPPSDDAEDDGPEEDLGEGQGPG